MFNTTGHRSPLLAQDRYGKLILIQTAGGGMYGGGAYLTAQSEGYIPAVGIQEAEQMRTFLVNKLNKGRAKQGL